MDLNTEYNATIFYLKFLKAVLVTKNLPDLLKMAEELGIDYKSLELLKMLRDLVSSYTKNNSLPHEVNQNLYNFINICRFEVNTDDRKERFSVCNDILGSINSSQDKEPYPLYQTMIGAYYPNLFEYFLNYALYVEEPDIIKEVLSSATELEFLILLFHSSIIEGEEFVYEISEDLILSLIYLLASDHLLREYPELLKDKLYLSRLNYILKNNEMLLEQYNGTIEEDCIFELGDGDEEMIKSKEFWKLHQKVKKKVLKAQKDS